MSGGQGQALVSTGWALIRAGNARGAAQRFRSALAENPEHVAALIGLSQAQLNASELSEASDTIATLLRVAPNQAIAHRLRAEACRRRRRLPEALAAARQGVALDPSAPAGYHILALVEVARKRRKQALLTVEEGLKQAPHSALLMSQRADLLLDIRNPGVAEPVARDALLADPGSLYGLRVAGRIALARGKLAEARDLLAQVLRRNANDEAALSLYVLTDPKRHGFVRGMVLFRYWRRDHPVRGTAAAVAIALVLLVAAIALGVASMGLFYVVLLGARFWMRRQNSQYRAEVKAHFKSYGLSEGY